MSGVAVPTHRHAGIKAICRFFTSDHIQRQDLKDIIEGCADLAQEMVDNPALDGPELTVGLRKLLEAKDCFVRSALHGD